LKPSEVSAPGFYWILGRGDEAPTVALFENGDWQFIGSLTIVSPREVDEEEVEVLAGPIPPPQWAR
jgi:hypothetical protein